MTNHPNRGALPRPAILLREISRRHPDAWKHYDDFRRDRGKDGLPDWPEWCFAPMAVAYAVVSRGGSLDGNLPAMSDIQAVAALAAWRVTQGIYRFDPALAAAIRPTPINDIPIHILCRLPEWCVYIEETPDAGGFFCHLESDANTGKPELRFLIDLPGKVPAAIPLHLDQPTLDLALDAAIAESRCQLVRTGRTLALDLLPENFIDELSATVSPMLNLVLYLCAENSDIGGERQERPRPIKTKKGWKLFPPDKPRVWDVGSRIGAALRSAYLAEQTEQQTGLTETGRQSPRPHIRRSHWHTYRTGEGRANSILRWLPPIPVKIEDGDIVPTVRKIK